MTRQLHVTDPMFSHERQDVLGDIPSGVGILISGLGGDDDQIGEITRTCLRLECPSGKDRGRLDSHPVAQNDLHREPFFPDLIVMAAPSCSPVRRTVRGRLSSVSASSPIWRNSVSERGCLLLTARSTK